MGFYLLHNYLVQVEEKSCRKISRTSRASSSFLGTLESLPQAPPPTHTQFVLARGGSERAREATVAGEQ